MSRREMLELIGGSMMVGSSADGRRRESISGGGGSGTDAPMAVSQSALSVEHLFTPSRNAGIVVWKEGDQIYADGEDGLIADGGSFGDVMQTVMNTSPSKVVIQAGTYHLNKTIRIPSATIVTGMGSETKIVVGDTSRGFLISGEKHQSMGLRADGQIGDGTLKVEDASRIQNAIEEHGSEYVLVNSDRTTDYRGQPFGELQRIRDVNSSNNTIRIEEGGLFDYYRTADNAKVTLVSMTTNVNVRDLQIVGVDQDRYRSGIVTRYADRVFIRNCEIHRLTNAAILISSSMNTEVKGCALYNIRHPTQGLGYGVTINDASRNVTVRNNTLYDMKQHCTAVGGSRDGYPRILTFVENEYYQNDADVHFGDQIYFRSNRFVNGEASLLLGSDNTRVESCLFANIQTDAINQRGSTEELTITESVFRNVQGRAIDLYTNPSRFRRLNIQNSKFRNIDSNLLRFRTNRGTTAKLLEFSNNVAYDIGANAVYAETLENSTLTDFVCHSNTMANIDGLALGTGRFDGNVNITRNVIRNVANPYVLIARGKRNRVTNNMVRNFSSRGLRVETPSFLFGNTFVKGGNSAIIVMGGTTDVVAAFNDFSDTQSADIEANDVSNSKFIFNDIDTGISVTGTDNVVRDNWDTI